MQCLAPHHNSPMAPLSQASFPRLTARCDNHPVGAVHSKQGLRPKEKHPMKQLFACTGLLLAATTLFAQTDATKPPPASPPATASVTIGRNLTAITQGRLGKTITIVYSSPGVKGRAGRLFTKDGQIAKDPTYPVWRAGANSATSLHTTGAIHIGDLAVPAGDYTLYVDIADPDKWILVVNKQTGQWGTKYDKSMDLGRTPMTMSAPPSLVENLKYTLTDNGGGTGSLTLAWENKSGSVSISAH
jgi:hypothetical protein